MAVSPGHHNLVFLSFECSKGVLMALNPLRGALGLDSEGAK